jgi:serine/threonine protein kinase
LGFSFRGHFFMTEDAELERVLVDHGFIFKGKLGSGRTSSVFLVESVRYLSHPFAIKLMRDAQDSEMVHREVTMLCGLTHRNVIQLYEYFEDRETFYFVLEYCPGGCLMDILMRHGALPAEVLYPYCMEIVSGLA